MNAGEEVKKSFSYICVMWRSYSSLFAFSGPQLNDGVACPHDALQSGQGYVEVRSNLFPGPISIGQGSQHLHLLLVGEVLSAGGHGGL